MRLRGIAWRMSPIRASIPSIISDSKAPGAMALTLMLKRAHSTASVSVIRTTAAVLIRRRRGDVDDAAGCSGVDQPARHLTAEHEGRTDVDVQHPVDQLQRHLVRPLGVGDARVVDQD